MSETNDYSEALDYRPELNEDAKFDNKFANRIPPFDPGRIELTLSMVMSGSAIRITPEECKAMLFDGSVSKDGRTTALADAICELEPIWLHDLFSAGGVSVRKIANFVRNHAKQVPPHPDTVCALNFYSDEPEEYTPFELDKTSVAAPLIR